MTIVTRTNLATNPTTVSATNYLAVPGTGGTASVAWNSGAGYVASHNMARVTWTVATTAISGGFSYTQTGLAANTQYATQFWVRSSKAQTMALTVAFRNASNAVVNTVTGSSVALTANTWTQLAVVGTSGAAVTNAVFTAQAATGGALWAANDTLDADAAFIEATATVGTYFDGNFTNANSIMYGWTGTAGASPSTAKTYTPVIALLAKPTFDPCPRVEITITDATPTNNIVNVWRTADGKRQAVRGARKWAVNGSNFIVDYEAPLGRSVLYDIEVTAGVNAGTNVTQQSVTVNAATGCIQDPLSPSSSIPIYADRSPNGEPLLRSAAFKALEYVAGMNIIPILGSPDPVALLGQRMSAANVDFSMLTNAAQQSTNLRNILKQAPLVLVRPLPGWASALPGLCYLASGVAAEQPVNEAIGFSLIRWQLKGDLVAAPTMNVLVPVWTYGGVPALWSTYQQAQTTLAGKTYLDVLKSPSGV